MVRFGCLNKLKCVVNYEVKLESGRTLMKNSNVEFYLHEGNDTVITWFHFSSNFLLSNTSFKKPCFTFFRSFMSCHQHSTEDNAKGGKCRTVRAVSL